ncbi:hypothetical protein V1509DRAFT_517985 [Lipomyces kononenkoae]
MKDKVFQYLSKNDNGKAFERKFCKTICSTDDRTRLIKRLAKCPTAPAGLKTVTGYSSVVDQLDNPSANDQTPSASVVRSLSSAANMGRWIDSITHGKMQELQQELADFFFTSGLPFDLVDKPVFRKWVNHLRPAFEIPHRKEVATTILNDSYDRMEALMILKTQAESHMTLVTDSWTNIRREAIANYVLRWGSYVSQCRPNWNRISHGKLFVQANR